MRSGLGFTGIIGVIGFRVYLEDKVDLVSRS